MRSKPWDARIAAALVRPLCGTWVRPNHLTTLRLMVGLAGVAMLAVGGHGWMVAGAALFVLSNLLDHFDGELARMSGRSSRFGHYYDLACDALIHTLVFAAIGFGLRDSGIGLWNLALGSVAGLSISSIFYMRMVIEDRLGKSATALNHCYGFDTEDVLYLLLPVVWLGWSQPMLWCVAIGASLYAVFQVWELRHKFSATGDRRG